MTDQELGAFLERNGQFHSKVSENLFKLTPYPEQRYHLAVKSARLSVEHGAAAFVLVSKKLFSPGFTLLRPQFETLVRGMWLMYAANDTWIEKLDQPLTPETAEAAKDALMVDKMLKALRTVESAPKPIIAQLDECRGVLIKALNSYAHGGFHPLARIETGYPPELAYDVLRNSNALIAIASQLAAIASGDSRNVKQVRALHTTFADCLPIINP